MWDWLDDLIMDTLRIFIIIIFIAGVVCLCLNLKEDIKNNKEMTCYSVFCGANYIGGIYSPRICVVCKENKDDLQK